MRLAKPIVGMAATPTGKGYWLVASDGGIFSFGDARFHGAASNMTLGRSVVADRDDRRRQGLLAGRERRHDVHLR